MDNHDKLYEQFREASQKTEGKDFPGIEKVWSRVEDKLDKKDDRKAIALWKKVAVAASLLLFFTIGYQFFKSSDSIAPKVTNENNPIVNELPKVRPANPEVIVNTEKPNSLIKENSDKILKEQINKPEPVVVNDTPDYNTKSRRAVISTQSYSVTSSKGITPASNNKNFKDEAYPIAFETDKNEIVSGTEVAKEKSADKNSSAEGLVSGVVTENNLPLPGATVTLKGTASTVQTDFDGKFTIQAKKGDQLIFNFLGFVSNIITVNNKSTLNVVMKPDAVALNEVTVNQGYKSTTNKTIAYSVRTETKQSKAGRANLGADQLERESKIYRNGDVNKTGSNLYDEDDKLEERADKSVIQNLQRQVAGLNVASGSGVPGADSTIILRGVGTIAGNVEPLFIVDGVPVDEPGFRSLNQNDITAINILKGAAATSIYGNRGNNGVIVITTKNGNFKHLSKRELRKKLLEIKKALKQKPQTSIVKPIEADNEDYDSFVENQFENPKNAPLSTFSIDVDNASYTNIRRFINNGQTVPKDAVRIEEMVNFFKYKYPQPSDSHPFSINTEYSACPWNAKHKLLRIGLQGKDIPTTTLPASNLVFLIDVSGSMEMENKLPLLVQSLKVLVNELRPKDKVAIVVYAGAAGLVLPPTSGDNKKIILEALDKLTAGGSTAGGAGIELAYQLAQENFIKGGNNRIVLATDGDFNVGNSSDTDMQTLIEEKRKSGVFLTCLGYGMGNYKDSKMEILADKGNGNYAYIDNMQEAGRFLGKEFRGSMYAIAKDVKIQIEFNPKIVQAYRLLGYENRKLRAEDFANDAIDAGELGSGHTVTALYEIIPAGVTSSYFTEQQELKYTKSETVGTVFNDELATIKFRYKKPEGDKSTEMIQIVKNKPAAADQVSDDFKFSAAVAWFGLKLRDSKLLENKSSVEIIKLARQGLANDGEGYRAEFIRLVESVK